jgi:hypothetical protein
MATPCPLPRPQSWPFAAPGVAVCPCPRDGLVSLLGGVLVDERGPGAGVSHSLHQLPEACALARRHRVSGVPQIVKMQLGQAHGGAGLGPGPPEGRPPKPATLRADQAAPLRGAGPGVSAAAQPWEARAAHAGPQLAQQTQISRISSAPTRCMLPVSAAQRATQADLYRWRQCASSPRSSACASPVQRHG